MVTEKSIKFVRAQEIFQQRVERMADVFHKFGPCFALDGQAERITDRHPIAPLAL